MSTLSWAGKNVLVVGGTQGIGAATALAFAKAGASVTFTGRNQTLGSEMLNQLSSKSTAPMAFETFDVTRMSEVRAFTESYKQKHKELHALVLCAGGLNYGPRRDTPEGLESTFAQNVASRFLVTKNLSSLFKNASVINCLGAGNGSDLDINDLELKQNYSLLRAAGQYASMNDLLAFVRFNARSLLSGIPTALFIRTLRSLLSGRCKYSERCQSAFPMVDSICSKLGVTHCGYIPDNDWRKNCADCFRRSTAKWTRISTRSDRKHGQDVFFGGKTSRME